MADETQQSEAAPVAAAAPATAPDPTAAPSNPVTAPSSQMPDTTPSPVSGQAPASPDIQAALAQKQATDQAVQAQAQHEQMLGKVAKFLMGKESTYSVDPNTGKTVETPVQSSPSDFWRRIVGGAILGGMVGSKAGADAGNPFAAAVAGAGAVQQHNDQQDQQKQQAARDDFKQSQEAARGKREQQEFDTNEILRKQQIHANNMESLKTDMALEGQSYDLHKGEVDRQAGNLDAYSQSGIKPVFQHIPSYQIAKTIQGNPGAGSLDWVPSGVNAADPKTGLVYLADGEEKETGEDGNPAHYVTTYSAFDPKSPVTVTQATIDGWKKSGLFDNGVLPDGASDAIKPGTQMPAQQFINLRTLADRANQKNLADQIQADNAAKVHAESVEATGKARAVTPGSVEYSEARAKNLAELRHTQAETFASSASAQKTEEEIKQLKTADGGPPVVVNGKTFPNNVAALGESYMNGNAAKATITGGMGGQKIWSAVQDYVNTKHPNYDYAGHETEYKYFSDKGTQNKLLAVTTLVGPDGNGGLLGDLQNAVHKAGLTQFPALNDAQNWSRVASGLGTGITGRQLSNDVAEQFGTIFANGGETSDMKIRLGQEQFNKAFNAQQTDTAVNAARMAIGDRLAAAGSQNRFIARKYAPIIGTAETTKWLSDGKRIFHKNGQTLYSTDGKTGYPVPPQYTPYLPQADK
jgi:hypothetical protein